MSALSAALKKLRRLTIEWGRSCHPPMPARVGALRRLDWGAVFALSAHLPIKLRYSLGNGPRGGNARPETSLTGKGPRGAAGKDFIPLNISQMPSTETRDGVYRRARQARGRWLE